VKPKPHAKDLATAVVQRLHSAGFTAFWVGGCVRDMLMGVDPKDYDIATDAPPSSVMDLFPGAAAVGKAFGVVRAPLEGVVFEVATFRQDQVYRDGRRPEGVTFTDPATDACRRDFSVNALFFDPVAAELHDYVGGRRDIEARIVRCVGDPGQRFAEDYLRMLRAVRFASVLEFSLEPGTASAIRELASRAGSVSGERVRDELGRMLTESRRAGASLVLLRDVGLLSVLLPEVAAMQGVVQPPEFHPEGDVFEHTVTMLDLMRAPGLHLAYAALLHDVGKPATARLVEQRMRFNGHAVQGAGVARSVLERLRFSGSDIKTITHCIGNHMRFIDVRRMKESRLRRLVGSPSFPVELELHRLDCLASHGKLDNYEFLVDFRKKMAEEPVLPPPWVRGSDILGMGVPEGPRVGRWRRLAYDAQLEGRLGSRSELLAWVRTQIEQENVKHEDGDD